MTRSIAWTLAALSFAALGCNDSTETGIPNLSGKPAFAVQLADFMSSSGVALIDGDGKLFKDKYISSGTEIAGLNAALAGDIALPTQPCGSDVLTVVARLGGDYVLQVDMKSGKVLRQVRTQTASGMGAYDSNPQDILCLAGDKALVSRSAPNTTLPDTDLDFGDDLALIDLKTQQITSRVDLSAFRGKAIVTKDGNTMEEVAYAAPGSIVELQNHAVVGLSRLSVNFNFDPQGLIAVVDLDKLTAKSVELPGLANCGSLVPVAGRDDAVIVQCAGAPYGNRDNAGLALVALDDAGKATIEHTLKPKDSEPLLYAGATSAGGTHAIVVEQDYVTMSPDTAYLVDLATGSAKKLFTAKNAGDIGSGAYRNDTGLLLIPDASTGVHVFQKNGDSFKESATLALDASLPARAVRPLVAF